MSKLAVAAIMLAVSLVPWLIGGKYLLHMATMTAIMSILGLSMNLMLRIGQASMAQGAFMAIGAYVSALLVLRLGVSPPLAMIIGAVGAGVLATLLGLVVLRIKGVFFVLLTYAFGQIVNLGIQEASPLTGGNNGLYGIPKFSIFGIRIADAPTYYLMTVGFAILAYLMVSAIYRSRIGDILNSINQDEELSRSLGVNALAWRTAVFGVSAAMAAVAGSLYAHHLNFLSPSTFSFLLSVDLLVINIVGGVLSPLGPVIGALIIVPLPELLRDAKQFQLLAYGSLLLVFLLFFREGIVGFVSRFQRKRTRAKTSPGPEGSHAKA